MTAPAYYGQPILKPPTWTDLIPVYFFSGGLAGVSGMLSFVARLRADDELERAMDVTTVSATGVSAFCLIKDLGKPWRFINMLRVMKPTSPMSIGTYVFSFFSSASLSGIALDALGIGRPFATAMRAGAALSGPFLSTYTGVLIADTAVPAWHEARGSLPVLFGAGAAMSGAGAGLLLGPAAGDMCRTLALVGVCGELAMLRRIHSELGSELHKAFETGRANAFSVWAKRLAIAGAGATLLAGRVRLLRRVSGALLLSSALLERFSVMEAGRMSAKDPSYVIAQQTSS